MTPFLCFVKLALCFVKSVHTFSENNKQAKKSSNDTPRAPYKRYAECSIKDHLEPALV